VADISRVTVTESEANDNGIVAEAELPEHDYRITYYR